MVRAGKQLGAIYAMAYPWRSTCHDMGGDKLRPQLLKARKSAANLNYGFRKDAPHSISDDAAG
jgi:hypothetical protein